MNKNKKISNKVEILDVGTKVTYNNRLATIEDDDRGNCLDSLSDLNYFIKYCDESYKFDALWYDEMVHYSEVVPVNNINIKN